MRTIDIAPGEYYHLFNRGTRKSTLFYDPRDYARFLFLLLHLQSLTTVANSSYHVTKFISLRETDKFGGFASVSRKTVDTITQQRQVELVAFCLMPNHFHLCVKEVIEGGIARYMQRTLMGYTKYFNTKYTTSGHVFQGPYRAVHQSDNEQFLHLSSYIHKNPRELKEWKNREQHYFWSSLCDYTKQNRWGDLLHQAIIHEQFSPAEYMQFVKSSPAKDTFDPIYQSPGD